MKTSKGSTLIEIGNIGLPYNEEKYLLVRLK